MIRKLDWDSDFFNLKVGELRLANNLGSYEASEYDLLYVTAEADFELQIAGFTKSFSEQKVKFSKSIFLNGKFSNDVFSYNETEYDTQDLYQLAYESGKHSRFRLDRNFDTEKFKDLYRLWIDNSIHSNFADDVLLYKNDGKVVGLLTYKIEQHNANVGLIAVSPQQQGKGIGGILLNHLEAVLSESGITDLTIPTQHENEQACRFYTRSGYVISEKNFIKHYWKDK